MLSLKALPNTTPFSIPDSDLRRHTLGFSSIAIFGGEDRWTIELTFCNHEGRMFNGRGEAETPYLALRAAESSLAADIAKPREASAPQAMPRTKAMSSGAALLKEIGL